ncbi:MAG TPA: Holliday junction branch migration protein RuvA [Candidatus Saccharimonadales bacterium]|nr:Holliday junction branch migration protein RuvA [Candidatus Saccharimonadales bacterium]
MIATLSGAVSEKMADSIVVDVGGVGYGVFVTSEDYGHLTTAQDTKLYIYEHIRETAHELFGFTKVNTKRLFEQLLNVNGIGPRMALNVLSIGSVDDVRQAIAAGDVRFIQAAPGVGKRVAERIVVELKDKVGLEAVELDSIGMLRGASLQQDEALQALLSLGYNPHDASMALQQVPADLPTEERVKQALKRRGA